MLSSYPSLWYNPASQYEGTNIISPNDLTIFSKFTSNFNVGGINWVSTPFAGESLQGVAMSSSGQYQTAVSKSNQLQEYGTLIRSIDYGQTWLVSTAYRNNWQAIAISSSGQYQLAGTNLDLFISTNYGETWARSTTYPSGQYNAVAISASGQYQLAVQSSGVYLSHDYGSRFDLLYTIANCIGITLSSSAQYQTLLTSTGSVFISASYGQSWTAPSSPPSITGESTGIIMSASGQYQSLCASNGVWTSTDFGKTWIASALNGPLSYFSAITMSTSAQYQVVVANSGTDGVGYTAVYLSSDYGNTWSSPSPTITSDFTSVAISSTGQYITMVSYSTTHIGAIFVSNANYPLSISNGNVLIGSTGTNAQLLINGVVKPFIIDHPNKDDHYLIHACLEGPEAGVYYRGKAEIYDRSTIVALPDYVDALADEFTVHVTHEMEEDEIVHVSASTIRQNQFRICASAPCKVNWVVFGNRKHTTIPIEVKKKDVIVYGDGPYKYI